MEGLMEVSKLKTKELEVRRTGISKFIRSRLDEVPAGQAIALKALAKIVAENCESVPDEQQAYVRINHVLKTKPYDKLFKRYTLDDDSRTVYVGKEDAAPSKQADPA